MKIAQLINSLHTGGAEKLIVETISLFNEQQIGMDLILLNGSKTPFYELLKLKTSSKIISLGNLSVYNPLLILKIIPLLKKYDIIHVHLFPSLYWAAIAKMFSFSKTKLVFTEHSTSNRRMENVLFKPIDKFIYSRYSKIITISEKVDFAIKKSLQFTDNKFVMIKNGVNLQTIENARKISKSIITNIENENRKVIIQVSSFQYPKDQFTLIKAMKLLPENTILWLVGDGIDKLKAEKSVTELQLQNRIFFLGIRMDVPSLLKSADIVVLSSHHEGLSLSSVEGLASGKPFLASNVPGLTEVVENAGLLFEVNNEVELANHINNLLNNENYYNETAQKCLAKSKEFDINKMVSQEIELYKNL
jgi:glycosyltransferase involved in cell wall biosynthesis